MTTAVDLGGLKGSGFLLTPDDLFPAWHHQAACLNRGTEAFFQGHQGHEAKEICGGCPVMVDCLEASISCGTDDGIEHYGIWGGAGAVQRRLMRRLRLDRPHDAPGPVDGCECRWCLEVRRHIARLEIGGSTTRNTNSPPPPNRNGPGGARHARRVTFNKGCRCPGCRWAATTSAQRLARAGFDTTDHWDAITKGWNMEDPATAAAARLVAGIEAMVATGDLPPRCELHKSAEALKAELDPDADRLAAFMTAGDVAARCGVTDRTVRRLVQEGHLPGVHITPHTLRIRRSDVEAHEAAQTAPALQEAA